MWTPRWQPEIAGRPTWLELEDSWLRRGIGVQQRALTVDALNE